jgi:hypothetical protein
MCSGKEKWDKFIAMNVEHKMNRSMYNYEILHSRNLVQAVSKVF